MYKAALEGIAYSIAQHVQIMEENGLPVKKIMAVGGGTRNEPWLQIIADVTGKAVHTSEVSMGAAYGDALMASLKAGFYENWEALARVIRPAKTYLPDLENAAYYQDHKELFAKLYEINKSTMHDLSKERKNV